MSYGSKQNKSHPNKNAVHSEVGLGSRTGYGSKQNKSHPDRGYVPPDVNDGPINFHHAIAAGDSYKDAARRAGAKVTVDLKSDKSSKTNK